MTRPAFEFSDTELIPWKPVEGEPGRYEKILSKDPETGSYTRLLMVEPDMDDFTEHPKVAPHQPLCHDDFVEEAFLIKGTLIDTLNKKTYSEGFYACRPAGMKHGPFLHPGRTIALEIRTYVKK